MNREMWGLMRVIEETLSVAADIASPGTEDLEEFGKEVRKRLNGYGLTAQEDSE